MDKRRLGRIAAVVITLTVAAGGCSNVSEEPVVSETSESFAAVAETTTVSSETETETTTAVTSVSETETFSESSESETEESETDTDTSDMSDESDTDTELSETEETTTSRSWSETNSSGTMYIAVDCVGREAADNNSTIITKYQQGDRVEIAALTDSGFYKIKGGGYIHSEYLTDNPVSETTVTSETTAAKTTKKTTSKTSAEETSEIFIDDNTGSDGNSPAPSTAKSYKDRYAYKQLSAAEQQLYADIVKAADTFENAVMIPDGVSSNDAIKVYKIVYNEEPQLFWLGSSISASGSVLTVNYKATRSEKEKMQAEIDANASPVVARVNGASSDYEKFKIIYEYIVLNSTFSLSSEGYNPTIYNAFTKSGELQCAGYAKAFQYLCDLCGLESTVVVGTNEEGDSHAWNVVYCGDGYYNIDTTWGDPINSYDDRYLRHTYFLVPDSQIHNISHFNVNCYFASNGAKVKCFDPPKCTKTTYNYFVQEGLYFKDLDSADAAIKELIKKAVANKENVIQIRVANEELFDRLTTGSAPGAYQKYAKSLSSSVKGIGKYTTKSYKATGVVTIEINYN